MRYFKQILILLCSLSTTVITHAQDYIYAVPIDEVSASGGDGSIGDPWDLQTALNNVEAGETLFLRDGTYNGRYYTGGQDGTDSLPITVTSYPGEWAILNGNVEDCTPININNYNTCNSVLMVFKNNYRFEDFEITMKDDPNTSDDDFSRYTGNFGNTTLPYIGGAGIEHHDGTNCKFINLVIHNMVGNGMFTSKNAGGAKIYGCVIYNNGNEDDGNDNPPNFSGSGIYIQNATEQWKNVSNNIFFNNFKVGAKLWSATDELEPGDTNDFLKHLNFDDNVILNTGSPLHPTRGKECFIMAGASETPGENIVHDVHINRNFMYHNDGYIDGPNQHAEAFRIGTAEVANNIYFNFAKDIYVLDNYFIGRKEGVKLIRVKDLVFKRNYVRSNYVFSVNNTDEYNVINSTINTMSSWDFDNNKYFSEFGNAQYADLFLLEKLDLPDTNSGRRLNQVNGDPPCTDLCFETLDSEVDFHYNLSSTIGTQKTISIIQNEYKSNRFKVVVYDKDGNDVIVDFNNGKYNYAIPAGTPYTIRDAENYFTILDEPEYIMGNDGEITVPMDLTILDMPNGHYPAKNSLDIIPKKSDPKVGVFIVEFGEAPCQTDYTLQDIETETETYEASNTIITAGASMEYIVESTANVTHKAGNFILLQDGTDIQSGSNYLATIEDCSVLSNRIAYVGENSKGSKKDSKNTDDDTIMNEVLVSPNPTSNSINISSHEAMANLKLSNVFGKIHFNVILNSESSKKTNLDLANLPTGMYFLKIKLTTGEIITKQVVKK